MFAHTKRSVRPSVEEPDPEQTCTCQRKLQACDDRTGTRPQHGLAMERAKAMAGNGVRLYITLYFRVFISLKAEGFMRELEYTVNISGFLSSAMPQFITTHTYTWTAHPVLSPNL